MFELKPVISVVSIHGSQALFFGSSVVVSLSLSWSIDTMFLVGKWVAFYSSIPVSIFFFFISQVSGSIYKQTRLILGAQFHRPPAKSLIKVGAKLYMLSLPLQYHVLFFRERPCFRSMASFGKNKKKTNMAFWIVFIQFFSPHL